MIYLKLALMAVIWGGTFVSGRMLSPDASPAAASFARFVVTAACLTLVVARQEGRLPRLSREALPWALGLAAFGVFGYQILFFYGLGVIPASRAAVIIAMNPVFTAVLSALVYKEPFPPAKALGVAMCVTGAVTAVTHGQIDQLFSSGLGRGEAALFGACCCWVGYSLTVKGAMRRMTPSAGVAWSAILGAVMLAPVAALELAGGGRLHFTANAVGNILYLGLLGTALATTWFGQGVKAIGPARASVFINFVPVAGILLSGLVLREPIDASLAVGGGLVAAGAWLANRPVQPPLPSQPAGAATRS